MHRDTLEQSIIQSVNRSSGRMLLYVWAVEQDELSKRVIPDFTASSPSPATSGTKAQDVLVPWVKTPAPATPKSPASTTSTTTPASNTDAPQVFQRYYHMFAAGELRDLAQRAASDLGLFVGRESDLDSSSPMDAKEKERANEIEVIHGMEVVADGWERSNYYLEARFWRAARPRNPSR